MIAASEPQEFVPYGRQQVRQHPGVKKESPPPFATSLLYKLSHFKIQDDKPSSEWWTLRGNSVVEDEEEEELYFSDRTAVWSKGMAGRSLATDTSAGRQLCSCYTLEEPIEQALWCNFSKLKNDKYVPIPSICLLESSSIKIFTSDGEDFLSSLQFKVSSIWATAFGLLLERMSSNPFLGGKPPFSPPSPTASPYFMEMQKLPKIFSLLHPLDEIAPVLVLKPGSSVGFMDNRYQKVVFTSSDPSVCMLYDTQSGQHSVWKIRKATSEEGQFMCGQDPSNMAHTSQSSLDVTGGALHNRIMASVSSVNRNHVYPSPLNGSHISMSGTRGSDSPLATGLNNSLVNPFKYINHSSVLMSSQAQTPSPTYSWGSQGMASVTRNHRDRGSPATPVFSDARLGTSQSVMDNGQEAKPIVPELCLEHIWSENLALACFHEGESCAASKVFIGKDLIGQSYLFYVIPSRSRLFCVSCSRTSRGDLNLSTLSTLPAKDAAYLPALQMIAVLEPAGGVVLYTGTAVIGKLHVAGISTALASPSYLSSSSLMIAQLQNNVSNCSGQSLPRRTSLLSSTVVGEAAFDEKVHLLSPVAPNTQSPVDFATPCHNLHSTPKDAHISSLRDPVANRLTLEFLNGTMFRVTLPNICSSPLVSRCLEVLKSVLPRDVALQVIVKWCGARNAPGTQDFSPTQEWQLFESHLLGLLGYNVDKLPATQLNSATIPETPSQILRKKRASYCGSLDDWEYLLSSHHHDKASHDLQSLLGLSEPLLSKESISDEAKCDSKDDIENVEASIDTSAMLFRSMHLILFSLHLLYEDLKLNLLLAESLPMLARLLHQLAADLRMIGYVEHYWRDFPTKCPIKVSSTQMSDENLNQLSAPVYVTATAPDVMKHVHHLIIEHSSLTVSPYPAILQVNQRSKDIVQMVGVLCTNTDNMEKLVKVIVPSGISSVSRHSKELSSVTKIKANTYEHAGRVVFLLSELGYTSTELSSLPAGIALVLNDAIHHVRESPPTDWPEAAFRLIGRQDLAASLPSVSDCQSPAVTSVRRHCNKSPLPAFTKPDKENEDGMESMDTEILKLRFSADHRIAEVRNLLQSSQPVTIAIPQRPEFSDHEFIEEQEKHLYAICTRTMALPVGRGMVTLHTSCPVASEPLQMPRLCLSGKAPPRGTTVDLSHIEVVPNMNLWPLFHNGVAAGLRISPSAKNINSSWIVYNKPKGGPEVLPEHAGFLMALGLNGHLSSLVELNTFKYLSRCHEMTSVGLLLGISATKRGTMDVRTTKVLSVHIESLLPPTSIELDIVQNIQVAALLGVGLVYQKTAHRHIAEVLLSEIGRPPGPEMENSVDRESYSLSAGLALGLVVLGTGSTATGLADLGIAETLYYYMVGGNKRPISGSQKEKYKSPSYQIKEGDEVNIDVTAPGATLALGMMFFNSGNKAVANWMKAPDTQFLLDFVCPDLLLLRIVARGLILWDDILPTEEWVQSHVPDVIRPYCLVKPVEENIDYETMNQAYCNIIAGACMAMGLKFAGSANNDAFTTLLKICKNFTTMFTKSIAELAGKSTIETCLNVVLLSLAMVMAGTGELEVIRLCRYLRSRVRQGSNSVVTYGSHLATHMALGLLFLGGGRYTLSTSAESVAVLLCAFFPKFPTHSNDNRYHLQAFRHLYVLAATPRLLLPRDIDSGSLCYAHLTVVYLDTPYYTNQSARLKAPCLLPELNLLKEVRVEDDRYWNIVFRRDANWDQLERILRGCKCLSVKQRAGCLSYREDPHGFRSLLAHTLTSDKVVSWSVPAESIFSFSSEPSTINFVRLFLECDDSSEASIKELEQLSFLTKLVFDCVTHDKISILPLWLSILEGIHMLTTNPVSAGHFVWQLKHMIDYAMNLPKSLLQSALAFDNPHDSRQKPYFSSDSLVTVDLAKTIKQHVCNLLDDWKQNDIREALISYMKYEEILASDACMAKLAMYVMFHNIPSPQLMAQALTIDASIINPLSVDRLLKSSENNLQHNKYNHLALLIGTVDSRLFN